MKPFKKNLSLLLFLIVVIIDLYAVNMGSRSLEVLIKPLIIPSLSLYYIVTVKNLNYWYLLALFFSFLGDLFLLDREKYFLVGLSFFLITHLIYIKIVMNYLGTIKILRISRLFLLFFAFLIMVIFFIKDNLGNKLIPVFFYGLVLIIFGLLSYLNLFYRKRKGNFSLFLGAFIFIISNAFIGLNMFYGSKVVLSIFTMLTYILAQYLICKSMISKNL